MQFFFLLINIFFYRPPYTDVTKDITHCFVEMNKTVKFDLAVFASLKIPCLNPVFLNDYLVTDPTPDVFEHCIPQYQEIMANMT